MLPFWYFWTTPTTIIFCSGGVRIIGLHFFDCYTSSPRITALICWIQLFLSLPRSNTVKIQLPILSRFYHTNNHISSLIDAVDEVVNTSYITEAKAGIENLAKRGNTSTRRASVRFVSFDEDEGTLICYILGKSKCVCHWGWGMNSTWMRSS